MSPSSYHQFPYSLVLKNSSKEFLIRQPPLAHFPVSLKPNPVRLLSNENTPVSATPPPYQIPGWIPRSQSTWPLSTQALLGTPLSLKLCQTWIPGHPLLLFVFFLTFLSSLHCCLLSFCWTSNIEDNQVSSHHFLLHWHSTFRRSHPVKCHLYAPAS